MQLDSTLLGEVWDRPPPMFLGDPTISRLDAFIRGYRCRSYEQRQQNDVSSFVEFGQWLASRFDVSGSLGFAGILLNQYENEEDAFSVFWEQRLEFLERDEESSPGLLQ